MATARAMPEAAVAVFAKAPVPGFAKTRLIPALGAAGAARLQEGLTGRAIETALAAQIGPVTLWCAPDAGHPFIEQLRRRCPMALADQPEGDLGARMLAAFAAAGRRLVLIGADCPCLEPHDLRAAATAAGDKVLPAATLWVTLEPCAMCAAAASFFRVRRVVFGAYDPKGGGVEHGPRLFAQPTCHHAPEVVGGVRETEAAALLRDFFAGLRPRG